MLREFIGKTASWGAVKGLPSFKTSVTIYQQTRRNMPEAVATLWEPEILQQYREPQNCISLMELLLLLLLLLLLVISLMQSIHDYVPETARLLWYIMLYLFCNYNSWHM